MRVRINQQTGVPPVDSSISLFASPGAASTAREPAPAAMVSTVIVSYQSAAFIGPCLRSLQRHAGVPIEVLISDNASNDGTVAAVQACCSEAELIRLDSNRGFAAAANLAAARARGDYLLFLNPDAELTEGALPSLLSYIQEHPGVAAVGPQFVFPDGRLQDSAFTYPSLLMTWFEFFPRPGRLLKTRLNGRLDSSDGSAIPVGHPLGACMLVRSQAWRGVGPFDEGFFLYCEEVDWCERARRAGWQISHLPAARVVHHGGMSAATAEAESLVQLYRSRRRLHRKHRSRLFGAASGFLTRLGLERERLRLRRAGRAARLEGVERALAEL